MITFVDTLNQISTSSQPCVLTIGNFDGVHLGHQAILQQLTDLATRLGVPAVALTFRNHPADILRADRPVSLLCSPTDRYRLLQSHGVSHVVSLPFSKAIAELPAERFLMQLRQHLPFSHLVLGHDATLGKGREGTPDVIRALAHKYDFQVHYVHAYHDHNQIISSSLIRAAIQAGRLDDAARWLGREVALSGHVVPGRGAGRTIGFPTLNVDVGGLCLPPYGVYRVTLRSDHCQRSFSGIANLGVAPTIRLGGPPVLEVHITEGFTVPIQGWVHVTLGRFIRPEQKFASIDALKAQITLDCTV